MAQLRDPYFIIFVFISMVAHGGFAPFLEALVPPGHKKTRHSCRVDFFCGEIPYEIWLMEEVRRVENDFVSSGCGRSCS